MSKEEALKLLNALTEATIRHYEVANGSRRGKLANAAIAEEKAARAIIEKLGVSEYVSSTQIGYALSW